MIWPSVQQFISPRFASIYCIELRPQAGNKDSTINNFHLWEQTVRSDNSFVIIKFSAVIVFFSVSTEMVS
jgi:hypothetical protein